MFDSLEMEDFGDEAWVAIFVSKFKQAMARETRVDVQACCVHVDKIQPGVMIPG
jgi:hypothetical protein